MISKKKRSALQILTAAAERSREGKNCNPGNQNWPVLLLSKCRLRSWGKVPAVEKGYKIHFFFLTLLIVKSRPGLPEQTPVKQYLSLQ